jgi:hypothetical protein
VSDAGRPILYYALGGGLGHLVRARRTVRALGLEREAAILTASAFAGDQRVTGGLPVVRVPRGLEREPARVRELIAAQRPAELIVDAFPLGILGELDGLEGVRVRHVARRLRWEAYRRRFGRGRIRFAVSHVLEPLDEQHERFLREHSDRVEPLDLGATIVPGRPRRAVPGPHWLVVHSGPHEEILELVEHAREHQRAEGVAVPIVVVSPERPAGLAEDVVWRDLHPVAPYFAHADRIFTAAGFNVIQETAPFRDRQHVVPFRRPLDDQSARAARVRRERLATAPRPAGA